MINNIIMLIFGSGIIFLLTYKTTHNIPTIMIDELTAMRNVSDKFLSVALDSQIIRNGHICLIMLKHFKQRSLPLKPAYLRIGGTDADMLIFDESNSVLNNVNCSFSTNHEQNIKAEKTNFSMSELVWSQINEFSHEVGFDLIFDLNVLLRINGNWDSANAQALFNYSNAHNYKVVWQLGNEPNSFRHVFETSVDPIQLGQDFKTLKNLLYKYPVYSSPVIIGPDVTRPKNLGEDSIKFLQNFLCSLDHSTINAVTWHQYYLKGSSANMNDFINPAIFNILEEQINAVQEVVDNCIPGTPIWLSETSTASGGGAPGLSDRYVAGFMWLDKLGMAAAKGIHVVIRQTLYHGHYSLLDPTLEPLPDWWLSVLYKKLVGQTVLNVKPFIRQGGHLRIYAHCSSFSEIKFKRSVLTLFGLNLDNATASIDLLSQGTNRLFISSYILTAPNLMSKSIHLNGKILTLLPNGTLPDLKPTMQISTKISIPAFAYAFWTIKVVCDFGENACLWTCVVDKDRRKEELTNLLQGGAANIIGCSGTRLLETYPKHLIRDNKDASTEKRFINAGLWLCTVMSLVLGLVLTAMSALFSLLNTVSNPTKPILSVDGLYYWNGFSALLDLLCLILWGVQFAITLKHNVAINETADKVSPTQYTSDGLSSIGWSYWMVLLALIFSAANICILFVRDYLIRKQPPTPEYNPEREVADGTLFLY